MVAQVQQTVWGLDACGGAGGGGVKGSMAGAGGSAVADERAAARRPAARDDAPKKMKQPSTTRKPRRQSRWPERSRRPVVATAMAAKGIAIVPTTMRSIQVAASPSD